MSKLKMIVWVDPDFKERVDRLAKEKQLSTSSFIREAVAERCDKIESPEVPQTAA